MRKNKGKVFSGLEPPDADRARREFIVRAAAGIIGTTLFFSGEARPTSGQPPKNLFYTKDHTWVHVNDGVGTIGVSNYVQSSLGAIGCFSFSQPYKKVGDRLRGGETFGVVASVESFDVKSPVSGKLLKVNEELESNPVWVNSEAYGKGWMIKVQMSDAKELGKLMDVPAYEAWVKGKPPLTTHRDCVDPSSKEFKYVVTDGCVNCKYTYCAAICPVEAFHETPDRVLINQVTCIGCSACVEECPVNAIFQGDLVPEKYEKSIEVNLEAENYPVICYKKPALRGPKCSGPPDGADARRGKAVVKISPRAS